MKKITVRLLALLMVTLMVLPMLFACGNTPEETTEKPEETQSPTESESESETLGGEIEEPQKPLELIKDGKSEFTLVMGKNAPFINDKAAYIIKNAVKEISGADLSIAMDYDLFINTLDPITKSKYLLQVDFEATGGAPGTFADREAIEATYDKSAPYEILIGNTDRPESAAAIADLKEENEYILRIDGNKLVLVASSNPALIAGAEALVSEYLSAEATELTIESLDKSATIEVAPPEENPEVFFGMTQDEVDAAFGDLLDGLFTNKTQETVVKVGMGSDFGMHFPEIYYKDGTYYAYYISYQNSKGVPSTGLATSTNGFDWKYEGQVINPDNPHDSGMSAFAGYWVDEDGIMYIVYESWSESHGGNVSLSVSYDDGATWISKGILLNHESFPNWCGYNIGTPDIYKKDGIWYVTFHGFGSNSGYGNEGCQIGVAYGENLLELTAEMSPVIPTEKDTAWSGTTGRRDVFFCDGYYYMVYEISTESVPGDGYAGAYWTHMFARSKDMITWEITSGPIITQDTPGMAFDGTCWCVIDGELYVFTRDRNLGTSAIKLVPVTE